jgi:hypothetical protein
MLVSEEWLFDRPGSTWAAEGEELRDCSHMTADEAVL